jgi:hypothetical protein
MKYKLILFVFTIFTTIANSQVQYHDIIPDDTVRNNLIYFLDIDSDGNNDLKFVH